jgi:hypothetical protein
VNRAPYRPRGTSLIWSLVALVALTAFCSLAVDVGRVHLVRAELRLAADSAARYGATGLGSGPTSVRARALSAAGDNKADGTFVTIDSTEDVDLGTWDTSTRTFTVLHGNNQASANAVRVTVSRTAARGSAVRLAFAGIVGRPTCDVRASAIAWAPPAPYGLVGLNYIKMSGNSTAAYWSTTGASAGPAGNIASNGDITLGGGSYVNGDAHPGPNHVVNGGMGHVAGAMTPLSAPLNYPNGDGSLARTANSNANVPAAYRTAGGDLALQKGDSLSLPGGTYYFHSFDLAADASLSFTGPTTLYLYGDLALNGGATTTYQNLARNLTIVLCPAPDGTPPGKVKINSSSALYATIYAPQSPVAITGSGAIYGSLLGLQVDMSGGSSVHYDRALDGAAAGVKLVE